MIGGFLINYDSRNSLKNAKKSSSILTEVQEDEDLSRLQSQSKIQKQQEKMPKKSVVV